MNQRFYSSWRRYVRNLDDVLRRMEERTTIAVGVAPYQRIIPTVFLSRRAYNIYAVKLSQDVETVRRYGTVYALEEHLPKVAAKVRSTNYLLHSYAFQGFLKSRQYPYDLLFYQTTPPIVQYLDEQNIPWVGNRPETFEPVLHKEGFREVLKQLKLMHLPDWTLTKEEFVQKSFEELFQRWQKPVVCQPGDYEVFGSTHFVHSPEDLRQAQETFGQDERFARVTTVKLSPFVVGDTLSMLGCITEKGVLSTPLQLQLIDPPESLHGYPAQGTFFGHDWGCRTWSQGAETDAQLTVEIFGEWLYERGYRGIFGIDFIYDNKKDRLYPLECNPRFTGAIPVYSEVNLLSGAPPIDFFTLASYRGIDVDFNFEAVNEAWKKKIDAAHVAITPQGIPTMKLNLPAGIYTINKQYQLEYLRPGAFLHELKNKDEFLIIDVIPLQGQPVMQTGVPRLFKLIFPVSIAENSKQLKPQYGAIITSLQNALRS